MRTNYLKQNTNIVLPFGDIMLQSNISDLNPSTVLGAPNFTFLYFHIHRFHFALALIFGQCVPAYK
jgi:hypothetical protein